ncbi:hypothetical protein EDD21DRAFT_363798 [Dissophora ornata]|nr:hypothetical protein EDD21DRAFT_363798 [Dissophora ornata]
MQRPQIKKLGGNITWLWTEEEDKLLKTFLSEGLTCAEFYKEFPNRTVCSLETRLSRFRQEGKKKIKELPTALQPKKIARWRAEEDEQLRAGVEKFGTENASWPKIANFAVDGKRLGRSTTSCKRRWDIIDPEKVRNLGSWEPAETAKLMMAIRDTLKEYEGGREGTGEGKEGQPQKRAGLSLMLGPDELARIDWREISKRMGTRSDVQCRSHIYKTMNSGMKGRWKDDEVERLREGLKDHGMDWKMLEVVVRTRSAFQIRQKYYLADGLTRPPAH